MDLIEKAQVKLAFTDQYLSFILGGINKQATTQEITYFGTKFLMAVVYEANSQEFTLMYNPKVIKKEGWKMPQLIAVLEHEVGHILSNHFSRQEDRDPLRWNIAADYALDQHIENAPRSEQELKMIKKDFKNNLAEEIYGKLPFSTKAPKTIFIMVNSLGKSTCPQCGGTGKGVCPDCKGSRKTKCDQCGGAGKDKDGKDCGNCQGSGETDCPSCRGTGQGDQPCETCDGAGTTQNQQVVLPREDVQGAVDQLVRRTTGKDLSEIASENQHGHQAGIWQTICKSLESHEIDWKILPKFLASFRDKRQRTLKRPSRRFPSPWGMRKRYEPKMAVAIDCSGSIGSIELDAFIAEVDHLTMITGEIHLVFADCSVQRVIPKYRAHQKLGTIPGRGGTDYDPALTYIDKTWPDTDLIVYLTDGECHPPEKKYRKPIIWIVTRRFDLDVSPMIRAPTLSKRGSSH